VTPASFLLQQELAQPDAAVDLGRAALLLAKLVYTDLDVEVYLRQLQQMAATIAAVLPTATTGLATIRLINQYFYEEWGFSGNRQDYYDPQNSFLNAVLERRTGIPISLSVVYMEVARQLGLPLAGVGLPGHFLIRHQQGEEIVYIDVFHQGRQLDSRGCDRLLQQVIGKPLKLDATFLRPVTKKEIIIRMFNNLKGIYLTGQDFGHALQVVTELRRFQPQENSLLREQGLIYWQLENWNAALQSLETYLATGLPESETSTIKSYILKIKNKLAALN
jgi:regulator of sirC expression with transglutaminase-like and TPR domain